MPKKLIRVDEECIVNGICQDPGRCALSLAINKATGYEAQLTGGHILLYDMKKQILVAKIPMSETVKRAVNLFDFSELQPLSFYLEY